MSIEIIGVALPFVALAWAILNWFAVEKLRKQAEADQKQAEAELSKALKNRDEALQNLEATKKKYAEFIQQLEKEEPMSRTRKTNITTSCPKIPVTSQAKPKKQVTPTRSMQSRPFSGPSAYQTQHNDLNPFDVVQDSQDIMHNFSNDSNSYSEPSPSYDSGPSSYDSGSSYDSFGGGSSDGGGASSDW